MINARLYTRNHCAVWYKVREDETLHRVYSDRVFGPRITRYLKEGINHPDFGYLSRYNIAASATPGKKLYNILWEISETYNLKFEWIEA